MTVPSARPHTSVWGLGLEGTQCIAPVADYWPLLYHRLQLVSHSQTAILFQLHLHNRWSGDFRLCFWYSGPPEVQTIGMWLLPFGRQTEKLSPHSWHSDVGIACYGHMINLPVPYPMMKVWCFTNAMRQECGFSIPNCLPNGSSLFEEASWVQD